MADLCPTRPTRFDPERPFIVVGAGSILLRGEIMRGLTTAASLWSVAGIGLAISGGMYTAALGATISILIILAGVTLLERRFISVKQQRNITLLVERCSVSLDSGHNALGTGSVRVKQLIVQQSEDDPELDDVRIGLSRATASEFEMICTRLAAMPGVRECRMADESGVGRDAYV
jgi:putative Mg2+ transporter-C (MgtC) family protein